jgi:solute carrier family 25 S-adenosylmethionine transporter 26
MSSAAVDFVCGAVAGAAADVCLFPLDTVRARLMVSTSVGAARRGVLREALALVRAEGPAALYKGLGVHLLASVPSNGIFYSTFEAARGALTALPTPSATGFAAAAGCLASIAIYSPMEVVKQRAMISKGASSASALRAILQADGPLGLYRGVAASALTWAPYFFSYFWAYDMLTTVVGRVPAGEQPPFFVALGCGLLAGTGASALTNPLDVVKTRLMVGPPAGGGGAKAAADAATARAAAAATGGAVGGGRGGLSAGLALARHIVRTEGVSGFARGALPRALMLAPASGLTIALYALVQSLADSAAAEERKRKAATAEDGEARG